MRLALASCLTALALLAGAVSAGWTRSVDATGLPASAWADTHGLVPALRFVEVAFAQTSVAAYAVLLAGLLLLARSVPAAVQVVAATVVTAVLTATTKALLSRPRPPWQLADHASTSAAFPSGHVSAVSALVTSVVLVAATAHRYVLPAALLGTGLGVVVAVDRVLLGRHYPSDVLGGALLGVAVALLVEHALLPTMGVRPLRPGDPDERHPRPVPG